MTLAGGFTSDLELRRSHTETEATNLNDLFPPPARPWLDGPAFYPCSPGGEPHSDDFLYTRRSALRRDRPKHWRSTFAVGCSPILLSPPPHESILYRKAQCTQACNVRHITPRAPTYYILPLFSFVKCNKERERADWAGRAVCSGRNRPLGAFGPDVADPVRPSGGRGSLRAPGRDRLVGSCALPDRTVSLGPCLRATMDYVHDPGWEMSQPPGY
jgi:hypothetical protein